VIELLVCCPVLWHVFSHGGSTDVDGSAVNLICNSSSGVPQTSTINEVCYIQGSVKLHFKITLKVIPLKLQLFSVLLLILVYLLLYWLEFQKCWALSFWLKCLLLSQKEIKMHASKLRIVWPVDTAQWTNWWHKAGYIGVCSWILNVRHWSTPRLTYLSKLLKYLVLFDQPKLFVTCITYWPNSQFSLNQRLPFWPTRRLPVSALKSSSNWLWQDNLSSDATNILHKAVTCLEVCHPCCVCENWKGYVVKYSYVN